jgi:hypothetical protein
VSNELDRRLVDLTAAVLCYAEFGLRGPLSEKVREAGPLAYWAEVNQESKERYYADAAKIVQFMAGGRFQIVPMDATPAMVSAARAIRPSLRYDSHAAEVWRDMLRASYEEMRWRRP